MALLVVTPATFRTRSQSHRHPISFPSISYPVLPITTEELDPLVSIGVFQPTEQISGSVLIPKRSMEFRFLWSNKAIKPARLRIHFSEPPVWRALEVLQFL
jgi:hypothetical protein